MSPNDDLPSSSRELAVASASAEADATLPLPSPVGSPKSSPSPYRNQSAVFIRGDPDNNRPLKPIIIGGTDTDVETEDDPSDSETIREFGSHRAQSANPIAPQAKEYQPVSIRAKNRRKRYLELHPEYFDNSALNPVLYDRFVRRFQTAAEREAAGRKKGLTGFLNDYLIRGEIEKDTPSHPRPFTMFGHVRDQDGELLPEDPDDIPESKEEGREWWVDEMTQKFLRGDDKDFEYETVDTNEEYNHPEEEKDRQQAWFESAEAELDCEDEKFKVDRTERDKVGYLLLEGFDY